MELFAWQRKNIAASSIELRSHPTLLLRGFHVPEAEAARESRAGPGDGSLTLVVLWAVRASLGASASEPIFHRRRLVRERQAPPRSALEGDGVIPTD